MTALLIVSFAFIFVGILINYINMYKRFDTPILGIFSKAEPDLVKNKVYAVKAEAPVEGEAAPAEGEQAPAVNEKAPAEDEKAPEGE
jgi:hypothetical protein